ncbi:Piso0_002497 [Millerozyma farinosa CBS 7064]|uniref:Piso0_002497 protein n=1 Tax=Pichia sorbitophila (strain ATCC MYA-4447 / BCRC 22081 / CBS 7064 / NBRC 10061 / NRRL Y-12695) TaxID=559304 RepID=G8YCS2_PICSO|nr:Piso0_002497 [Millerozyma farinosa CBS 7064]
MNMLFLYVLLVATCATVVTENVRWEAFQGYFTNAMHASEIEINNVLKSPNFYKNLPPILSVPKRSERTLKDGEIPQYAIDYAPLVHLYSEERYMPYDIAKFVKNFHATYPNGTKVKDTPDELQITDLPKLPRSPDIYLTSNSDFDKDPKWITGAHNVPSLIDGKIDKAPASLIVVDKGNGWVDAFWFYFYSFNLGPFVMGSGPYGNHVGDWEHSLVRFYKGEPIIVWMSAHGGGGAYFYRNLEKYKLDRRHPIIFSARGTHANYVSVGQHPHDLPYEILCDFTDRGPLWNPTKNYLAYTYDGKHIYPQTNRSGSSTDGRELSYGNWLSFEGHWGDKQLSSKDPRQRFSFIAGHKYIDGPSGPLSKNLIRLNPCERHKWWNFWNGCNVRRNIKWGLGIESEGYNCGNIFNWVRPRWLKEMFQKITWGGGMCFAVDLIFG